MSEYLSSIYNWVLGDKMEEDNPPWLTSVQGESPLFSSSQCKFIANVRSSIKHKSRSIRETSDARMQVVKQSADSVKANFQLVVKTLQNSSSSRQVFKENYPPFRRIRDMNVRQLRKIAHSIDTDTQNCAISKIIGSSISLIGGGICLFAGARDNHIPQMVGSAMMGLGNLTSTGTSAAEEMLRRENIGKAQKILQQDKAYIEELVAWLNDARCLQNAMDTIKSVNCGKHLLATAGKLQSVYKQNLSTRQMKRELQNIIKTLNIPPEFKEELSDIIGILVATAMLAERFLPLFKLALKSHNVMARMRLSMDIFRAAYSGMTAVSTVNSRGELTDAQKRKIVGGMALDAANILLVSLQERNSVEGQEIRKIANQLENDANELKILYESINSLDIGED